MPTALCTEHLFPSDNGCEDHYEAVEDVCLRISPFPRSFAEAKGPSIHDVRTIFGIYFAPPPYIVRILF